MALPRFEVKATAILDKYRITSAPVHIEDVAEGEGALIVRNHFPGYESGFALRDGGNWVIGVNTATSPRRQRFTIAHELGHLLLHEGKPLITDYSVLVNRRDAKSAMGTDSEEIEANGFAAAILMPQHIVMASLHEEVHSRVDTFRSRDELIAAMARRFDVSLEAMSYRLIRLNLITA
jgi:Zn-dependent peptidase ImmA (M78 family)